MAKKEMDDDLKQDKAMIKKAFREHDKQEHPGKHTKITLKKGGALKPVDKKAKPGLAKLPTEVRNKMGYMKKGGVTKAYAKGGVVSGEEKLVGRNLARVANQGSK